MRKCLCENEKGISLFAGIYFLFSFFSLLCSFEFKIDNLFEIMNRYSLIDLLLILLHYYW